VAAFSDELRPGRVLLRSFMGTELVLFKTRAGDAAATDPYCPHLGAHMGFGGEVVGEALRCPFHGFRFDTDGACVGTGYGTRPPASARLRTWPIREQNGLVLVHHGEEDRGPSWEIPAVDDRGWSAPVHLAVRLATHPQETTENSVDLGHFAYVHGYRSVRILRDVVSEGPYLSTEFEVERPWPLVGRLSRGTLLKFQFETHIYGLGYSLVHVRIPLAGLEARLWVLPTSVDAGHLVLRMAASVPPVAPRGRLLRLRPVGKVVQKAIAYGMLRALLTDARQDFRVWEHKKYLDRPSLAQGDGPIGAYRRWARQFYPRAEERDADNLVDCSADVTAS
jgi:nitrite reductase/ring-hydroxylating ferredoxin subunit